MMFAGTGDQTVGMKSKVHPKYKTKYRVANWSSYDRALVRRGAVTLWLAPEAIERRFGLRPVLSSGIWSVSYGVWSGVIGGRSSRNASREACKEPNRGRSRCEGTGSHRSRDPVLASSSPAARRAAAHAGTMQGESLFYSMR